jgi:hypothetical protein
MKNCSHQHNTEARRCSKPWKHPTSLRGRQAIQKGLPTKHQKEEVAQRKEREEDQQQQGNCTFATARQHSRTALSTRQATTPAKAQPSAQDQDINMEHFPEHLQDWDIEEIEEQKTDKCG